MDKDTNHICRLCLKKCDEFEAIDETKYQVLDVLLLTLNLAVSHEPVMCKLCADRLQKCFVFKTASLYTKNESTELGDRQYVCLFCKKLSMLGSAIFLNSESLDILLLRAMMEQYFPELSLFSVTQPVICTTCHELLQSNFEFIVSCLSVEERIRKHCEVVGCNSKGQIELVDVVNLVMEHKDCYSSSNVKKEDNWCIESGKISKCGNDIKVEDGGEKNTVNDAVKVEEIVVDQTVHIENVAEFEVKYLHEEFVINDDIKVEKGDTISESIEAVVRMCNSYKDDTNLGHVEDGANKLNCDNNIEEKRSAVDEEDNSTRIKRGKTSGGKNWWFNMETDGSPQQETFFSKSELSTMITRTKVSGEIKYQCQVCCYISKTMGNMKRHMSIHQHPSELTFYRCQECSFKTKVKATFVRHMNYHKDPSLIPMFKCQHCPFKTKGITNLRRHSVKHDERPDVIRLECHTCGYKTFYRRCMERHVLSHRKQAPQMYKCDKCSYQSMKKKYFNNHLIIHMDPSELTMYKCELCAYETKRKDKRVAHMESHREPVQCEFCEFKSKYTATINRHLRKVHDVKTIRRKTRKKL